MDDLYYSDILDFFDELFYYSKRRVDGVPNDVIYEEIRSGKHLTENDSDKGVQ